MFEEYVECVCVWVECGWDLGGEVVVGWCVDYEYFFWVIGDWVVWSYVVDLFFDVGFVVDGMSCYVDEVMYVWFDDYGNFCLFIGKVGMVWNWKNFVYCKGSGWLWVGVVGRCWIVWIFFFW